MKQYVMALLLLSIISPLVAANSGLSNPDLTEIGDSGTYYHNPNYNATNLTAAQNKTINRYTGTDQHTLNTSSVPSTRWPGMTETTLNAKMTETWSNGTLKKVNYNSEYDVVQTQMKIDNKTAPVQYFNRSHYEELQKNNSEAIAQLERERERIKIIDERNATLAAEAEANKKWYDDIPWTNILLVMLYAAIVIGLIILIRQQIERNRRKRNAQKPEEVAAAMLKAGYDEKYVEQVYEQMTRGKR